VQTGAGMTEGWCEEQIAAPAGAGNHIELKI